MVPHPERKTGRNDPCWCGSGKKYKNCHMREDEHAESRDLVTHNLVERLAEYALSREFKSDFETAFEFFTGRKFQAPEDQEDLIEFERVLDYFTYDYALPDGKRVVERFAAEHGQRLSADERALTADWQHARMTAFEVIAVEHGVGMRIRDVVSGEEFDVREKRGTRDLSRWEIVVTRLLRVQDHYELGGYSGLRLPSHYRDWLRGQIEEEQTNYEMNHPEATYEDFLHASSQLLYQFLVDEVIPALTTPPTMVTAEGDLMEMCRAIFDVLDYTAALAGLNAAGEFVGDEEEGEERSFAWQETGASLDLLRAHGPEFEHKEAMGADTPTGARYGGRRNLGNLRLTRESLTLEVTSRRRLEAGKELLALRLGRAIRHRVDEFKSMDEMLAQMPDALEEEAPAEEIPEEIEAMQAEMAAQYHRQWLDQRIPALEDQTPREAAKTFGGRVRVMRLLKEFEASEDRQARAGEISFDLDELKTELGIADQDLLAESRLEDQMRDALDEIFELTDKDRVDEALDGWRIWRKRYPIATCAELDFAEVWDLQEILDETIDFLVNRLAMFKRFDAAIELYDEFLALEPDDLDEVRAAIAELRAERGETEPALRELQALVAGAPGDFFVVRTLASVQRDLLDHPDDAIATLRRGLETVDPDWQDELYAEIVESYLEFGRADEAEKYWHAENDAEEEKDFLNLTRILLAQGDLNRARESANQIEDESARRHWLGRVEARAGHFDVARQLWTDNPVPEFDNWVFWSPWVEAHLRLRDFDLVIEKFDPRRLRPHAQGYFDLALAHAAKGDLQRAAELAQAGRAELEVRSRRIYQSTTLRAVRELADELQLSPAARQAVQI